MQPKLWLVRALSLCACTLFYSAFAFAQLAEPANDLGVRLGHIHLMVKDVEAQTKFWTEMMGGTVVKNGPLALIQFPGVFIMLRQGDATSPPAGSIVDHFGFVFKDITAARARWKAAGVEYTVGANNPNQGFVMAPDGVRVEVFGDPSLPGPVGMDHIHMLLPAKDIPAIQAWYDKSLGGLTGKRKTVANSGVTDCVYFHRFNVSFSPSDTQRAPTKGRSIDHIGFEVKNLDEFVKKLESAGNKLEAPPRLVPNSNVKIAFLTDPWGTYIELTENLAPAAQQAAIDGYIPRGTRPAKGLAPGLKVTDLGKGARTYRVNLAKGDEIMSGLTEFAEKYHIKNAHFTAVGAINKGLFGWSEGEGGRGQRRIELNQEAEIVSFLGSITVDNQGRSNVHGHGSVALSDGSVRGGHWWEAYVSIVAEVYVSEEEGASEPAK